MKQIKLGGKRYPGLFALVDDDDFEKLNKFKWFPIPGKKTFYAKAKINKKARYMHSVILECDAFSRPDHKNGNGLDNTRENLRPANKFENSWNSGLQNNSTVGYRGVTLRESGMYRARIGLYGKRIHLGNFKTAEEASLAYEKKAKEVHGVFYRSPK